MSENSNSYPESVKDDKFQEYPPSFKDEDESGNEDDLKDERGGKGKKKYSVIPQSVREKFIKRVLSKEVTIKEVTIKMIYFSYCLGCQRIWSKIFNIQSYSPNI